MGARTPDLSDLEWYDTLRSLEDATKHLKDPELTGKRVAGKRREMSSRRQLVIEKAREATNIDRKVVADMPEQGIKAQLKAFDKRVGTWKNFNRAFDLAEAFVKSVVPTEDRASQQAALAYELAETLRDELRGNTIHHQNKRITRFIGSALNNQHLLIDDHHNILGREKQERQTWVKQQGDLLIEVRDSLIATLEKQQIEFRITGHAATKHRRCTSGKG